MISKIFFILIFQIIRDVRRYLRNPDKLFRRVRDKHGNLRLSKAAKAYHPGRGVYRSSYRNALRLTATENNMAYRTADHLRWQQQPFVVGIEIKLSNNHTCKGVIGRFVDICDDLAGVYPKDFKFVGWHPHCRCYCVPKQASKEEFMEYQQRLLNGEDVSNYHFKGEVKDLPRNFKDWYTDNTDRIARAKSQPYFLRDNQKLIDKNIRTMNKMAMESGRLEGFVDLSIKEKNQIASKIREVGNKLEIFPKNVNVRFSTNLEENTLMAWDGTTIHISCGKYIMDNDSTFCPASDLLSAFMKLNNRAPGKLTFNEEYAIEMLFHESIHSKQLNATGNFMQEKILEISTQLLARNNYPKILGHFKKSPIHFDEIQSKGYGYKEGCNLLRQYFTRNGKLDTDLLSSIAKGSIDGVEKLLELMNQAGVSENEIRDIFKKIR